MAPPLLEPPRPKLSARARALAMLSLKSWSFLATVKIFSDEAGRSGFGRFGTTTWVSGTDTTATGKAFAAPGAFTQGPPVAISASEGDGFPSMLPTTVSPADNAGSREEDPRLLPARIFPSSTAELVAPAVTQ